MFREEGSDNGFEMIDKPNNPLTASGDLPGGRPGPPKAVNPILAPPSTLPSFVSNPPARAMNPPLLSNPTFNPVVVPNLSVVAAPAIPNQIPFQSSTSPAPQIFMPQVALASPGPQLPPEPAAVSLPYTVGYSEPSFVSPPSPSESQKSIGSTAGGIRSVGGLFGWVKESMPGKQLLTKMAEKARSSVDTMITTLDPQMKEFIYSGGDVDIVVASSAGNKVEPVRDALVAVFGKATVRGLDAQSVSVAAQPVGFPAALQSAMDRMAYLRNNGFVHPEQPLIAVEGFLVEFEADKWYDMALVLLNDAGRNITLQTYTQPTLVPGNAIMAMKAASPANYPLASTGFAMTTGQAISEQFHITPVEWHSQLSGVSRKEMIFLAAKSLAYGYKTTLGGR